MTDILLNLFKTLASEFIEKTFIRYLLDDSYISTADRKENICLSILQKWHTLPVCGYALVPEHVETRSLYHPNKPGVQQVTIVDWVD